MVWLIVSRSHLLPADNRSNIAAPNRTAHGGRQMEVMPAGKQAASFFAPIGNFFRKLFCGGSSNANRTQPSTKSSISRAKPRKTDPAIAKHGEPFQHLKVREQDTKETALRPGTLSKSQEGDAALRFVVQDIGLNNPTDRGDLDLRQLQMEFREVFDK